MDWLFKRYASPFVFIDTLLSVGRFSEFIDEFLRQREDEKEWEFYLHKIFNKSYDDFKRQIEPKPKVNLGTTVQNSFDMLQGFKPESG